MISPHESLAYSFSSITLYIHSHTHFNFQIYTLPQLDLHLTWHDRTGVSRNIQYNTTRTTHMIRCICLLTLGSMSFSVRHHLVVGTRETRGRRGTYIRHMMIYTFTCYLSYLCICVHCTNRACGLWCLRLAWLTGSFVKEEGIRHDTLRMWRCCMWIPDPEGLTNSIYRYIKDVCAWSYIK
jgi:hypothetical protein